MGTGFIRREQQVRFLSLGQTRWRRSAWRVAECVSAGRRSSQGTRGSVEPPGRFGEGVRKGSTRTALRLSGEHVVSRTYIGHQCLPLGRRLITSLSPLLPRFFFRKLLDKRPRRKVRSSHEQVLLPPRAGPQLAGRTRSRTDFDPGSRKDPGVFRFLTTPQRHITTGCRVVVTRLLREQENAGSNPVIRTTSAAATVRHGRP